MKELNKSNPYVSFKIDRERRIALIARDVRIVVVAALAGMSWGSSLDIPERQSAERTCWALAPLDKPRSHAAPIAHEGAAMIRKRCGQAP